MEEREREGGGATSNARARHTLRRPTTNEHLECTHKKIAKCKNGTLTLSEPQIVSSYGLVTASASKI